MTKFSFVFFLSAGLTAATDVFSQTADQDSVQQKMNRYVQEMTATQYVIIGGVSTDFRALDAQCKQLSNSTGIKYENSLVYDSNRGMIVPDTSSDEIYAGEYYPRRYASEELSIEMLWYYSSPQNRQKDKRMVLIAGIFGEKSDAEARLKTLKKKLPDAYIKKIAMYMGCMH